MLFLISGVLMGLAGSLHCLGMCGPIALALPLGGFSGARRTGLVFLYNTGRAYMYAMLGLLAGMAGKGLNLIGFQRYVSVGIGVFLIAVLLFPRSGLHRYLADSSFVISSRLRNRFSAALRRRSEISFLVIGLLNGMLPCATVYLALGAALAAGDPLGGSLFMFVFGFGTMPLMLAVSLIGKRFKGFTFRFRQTVPIITLLVAVLLILRGFGINPLISGEHSIHDAHSSKPIILCTGQNLAHSK
jgi:sulfite exporter TauE/SafE